METLTTNYHLRKQDENEFYSETINSDNMDIIDPELKKSADHIANTNLHVTVEKQAAWDNLKTFQTAEGTATAITLTGIELVDGFQTTFVILASNSGAATTINGKSLYKPGTTTAPKLIAGKAATVWYNLAGDCFFIKASAEGTATAADVLAGKTFSNGDDTGLTGTMIDYSTLVPGDSVLETSSATYTTSNLGNDGVFHKANEIQIAAGIGTVRVKYYAFSINVASQLKGAIFINGVQVGATKNLNSYTAGATISEDVAVSEGDYVQLFVSATGYANTVKNLQICCGIEFADFSIIR